jgi:hypothetical protein
MANELMANELMPYEPLPLAMSYKDGFLRRDPLMPGTACRGLVACNGVTRIDRVRAGALSV